MQLIYTIRKHPVWSQNAGRMPGARWRESQYTRRLDADVESAGADLCLSGTDVQCHVLVSRPLLQVPVVVVVAFLFGAGPLVVVGGVLKVLK